MESTLDIFIKAIFSENMIFAYFLGMCSYLAVSKTVKTAVGLGAAVIFVLVVTVPVNYLLENYLLKDGALAWLGPEYADLDLSFLHLSCNWLKCWLRNLLQHFMEPWEYSCL
jgi:Na+-transporting NADH:ubiquinone oxidoreductase subunit E